MVSNLSLDCPCTELRVVVVGFVKLWIDTVSGKKPSRKQVTVIRMCGIHCTGHCLYDLFGVMSVTVGSGYGQ